MFLTYVALALAAIGFVMTLNGIGWGLAVAFTGFALSAVENKRIRKEYEKDFYTRADRLRKARDRG